MMTTSVCLLCSVEHLPLLRLLPAYRATLPYSDGIFVLLWYWTRVSAILRSTYSCNNTCPGVYPPQVVMRPQDLTPTLSAEVERSSTYTRHELSQRLIHPSLAPIESVRHPPATITGTKESCWRQKRGLLRRGKARRRWQRRCRCLRRIAAVLGIQHGEALMSYKSWDARHPSCS